MVEGLEGTGFTPISCCVMTCLQVVDISSWVPPDLGSVKFNVDGVGSSNPVGYGGVGATRFSTSDKDLRVALLKSRFADTIFKAQQELKASVDTQGFDLKNSVGSKHRPETVNCVADKSKKRPKVAVHTTSTPRCPTILEEEMRTVDAARAERISTSGKDPRSAMLKSPFADPMLKDKAPQEMKAVKTLHPTPTIQQQREIVDVDAAEPKAHVDFKQQKDRDRRAAQIALEKMTNTAGIELNLDVQREFEILVGSSSRHY
ncbi:hypothetical protein V6N11_030657 [Hibiscus sabdariffa]|uniref:Uncharacterized protein n=2 Tax=Hibiscus sabdariffa TaxID=183260 RepID=A0ABR2AWH5_9ROSI